MLIPAFSFSGPRLVKYVIFSMSTKWTRHFLINRLPLQWINHLITDCWSVNIIYFTGTRLFSFKLLSVLNGYFMSMFVCSKERDNKSINKSQEKIQTSFICSHNEVVLFQKIKRFLKELMKRRLKTFSGQYCIWE